MSYAAFARMRKTNENLFGVSALPKNPTLHAFRSKNDLKSCILRFLHDRCENLRFDYEIEKAENESGEYRGTSFLPNQIPYNMQMDINRLCFERELERFIDSGSTEDAYTVYYCFLEIFFGHFGKSKKMVELFSEFETNGSSLLMKHRDHFSHSVYVFSLGLAIYESNSAFRKAYKVLYGFDPSDENQGEDCKAACCFLEFWGLAALFHDIGYSFEMPFEQIMSYYEVDGSSRDSVPFLAYHDIETVTALGEEARNHFEKLYGQYFSTIDELFAFDITQKLGKDYAFTYEYMSKVIRDKPIAPDTFGYFMDHAYFSSTRLFRELVNSLGIESITKRHVDSMTAILLHNSLYKFNISFFKSKNPKQPLCMASHPLAYLLLLCDQLQCWDRTAYGRNSRTELHPMAADFDFSNNSIHAVYYFDKQECSKIDAFFGKYKKWVDGGKEGKAPKLKAFSEMVGEKQPFVDESMRIVDMKDIPLSVVADYSREADRKNKHSYMSSSNFLHLYDFAVALNARYSNAEEANDSELEKVFENLSLEYQLSNINQAKSFAEYLDAIGCFYTDRQVDNEIIKSFTISQIKVFAPMEHGRWVREHISMSWKEGNLYNSVELPEAMVRQFGDEKTARKALREQFRMHDLAMDGCPSKTEILKHYKALPLVEKEKDYLPFNTMLKLIRKFDGLRIYKLK